MKALCVVVLIAAEQAAEVPPLLPAQPQLQGPEPDTEEAVPAAQRLVVGAAESLVPFELPQDPFTATGVTGA